MIIKTNIRPRVNVTVWTTDCPNCKKSNEFDGSPDDYQACGHCGYNFKLLGYETIFNPTDHDDTEDKKVPFTGQLKNDWEITY